MSHETDCFVPFFLEAIPVVQHGCLQLAHDMPTQNENRKGWVGRVERKGVTPPSPFPKAHSDGWMTYRFVLEADLGRRK